VSAWQILPLLVGVTVHSVVEKIRADSAIIQQGIALARRAVADERFAAVLCLDQKAQQLALGCANTFGEIGIGFQPVQAGLPLAEHQLGNSSQARMGRIAGVAGIDAQRAAVCPELLDVE